MAVKKQSLLFRGIYEFEDPSGCLMAARIPHTGTVDLYKNTVLIVRPNQCALFVYKGEITDTFLAGTHRLQTDNIPILSQLANYSLGFTNPLRCELWFFTNQIFTGRRWGTGQPVMHNFDGMGQVPIRAFGNYNVVLTDPEKFLMTLLGSRASYDITEVEDLVQGQIVEQLPEAMTMVTDIQKLNQSQNKVSDRLAVLVNKVLGKYGVKIIDLQVLSLTPSTEVLKAMDAKAAMSVIGDKREYLLYRAANSLDQLQQSGGAAGNDPMQMMMGLMLGKSLLAADFRKKEKVTAVTPEVQITGGEGYTGQTKFCSQCGAGLRSQDRFCSSCGEKQR